MHSKTVGSTNILLHLFPSSPFAKHKKQLANRSSQYTAAIKYTTFKATKNTQWRSHACTIFLTHPSKHQTLLTTSTKSRTAAKDSKSAAGTKSHTLLRATVLSSMYTISSSGTAQLKQKPSLVCCGRASATTSNVGIILYDHLGCCCTQPHPLQNKEFLLIFSQFY